MPLITSPAKYIYFDMNIVGQYELQHAREAATKLNKSWGEVWP
jgi:hypothetical protein